MKYGIILWAAFAAIFLLITGKILLKQATPLPHIINDMAELPVHRVSPPPPGAEPFAPTEQPPAPADGAALFALHCAACHGVNGTGQSYVASRPGMPEVSDLSSTASTEAELLDTLTNGRGAMPAFLSRLSAAARQALIHHILHLHHP